MAATVDDLRQLLKDILDQLKNGPASGKAGAGSTNQAQGQTLSGAFRQAFRSERSGFSGNAMAEGALGAESAAGLGEIAGGLAGGPIGMAAVATAGVISALAEAPGKVRDFVEGLHSANRSLSEFSGSMANVMAMSDLGDMLRSMNAGEAVAGSAGELASSRAGLLDTLQPVQNDMQNLQNQLGSLVADGMVKMLNETGILDLVSAAIKDVAQIADWIRELLDIEKDKEDEDVKISPFELWLAGVKRIEEEERGLRAPLAPALPIRGEGFGGNPAKGGDF